MQKDEQGGVGPAVSIGIEIAVGVGLGLWVGVWLDKKFGWAPWAALIGSVLGLAGGMYLAIKQVAKLNKD